MSRNVSESVEESWGMDELEGEERNAHTVESEPGVGGLGWGGLACGRRLRLSSSGHWSTKEAAPHSTKKCYSVTVLIWVCFFLWLLSQHVKHRRTRKIIVGLFSPRNRAGCGGGAEWHTEKL